MQKLYRWGQVVIVLLVVVTETGGLERATSAAPVAPVVASYNGGTIDLSQGWGTATVCDVTSSGTFCFSNQAAFDAWQSSSTEQSVVQPLTSCSSGLKLFQNIDYGGDELILSTRLSWLNLADYSFADELSSYEVGACSISMTDEAGGAGDVYPGATTAYSDVSWIGTAWNDRVQSVYIY